MPLSATTRLIHDNSPEQRVRVPLICRTCIHRLLVLLATHEDNSSYVMISLIHRPFLLPIFLD